MIASAYPRYRQALARPHQAYSRVEVWRLGAQVDELRWFENASTPYSTLQRVFFGGSVRATLGSRVTRELSLEVPDYLYPWETSDLLAPYGNDLRVFRGIKYGDGSVDEFPVFTGPIDEVGLPKLGVCTLRAVDLADVTAGAGFVRPLSAQAGSLITDEYRRLVLDADPNATFGTFDAIYELVPNGLAYEGDRGAALDNLAKSASAFWYTLANGDHVLRRIPWVFRPTAGAIVLTDGPGGTLLSGYPVRSRRGILNQVTVAVDRPDGGSALYATASDDDPDSPTYVDGAFRRRSALIRVTGAVNQGQLVTASRAAIRRSKALTSAWRITCTADASIELGDLLDVSSRGHQAFQIAAALTLPLAPAGEMSIEGRDLVDTELET